MFLKLFLFLTPITAIAGISAFGELSSQMTTYLVAVCAPFYAFVMWKEIVKMPPEVQIVGSMFLVSIVLSLIVSANSILYQSQYGRTGVSKFLSSTSVVFFGYFVTLIAFRSLRTSTTATPFQDMVSAPILWAVILNCFIAAFEFSSWFIEPLKVAYNFLSYNLFHTQHGFIDMPGRLRALGTEPSHLGVFAGFSLPWILAFQQRKPLYTVAIILIVAVSFLSTSRTAYVSVTIAFVTFLAVKLLIRRGGFPVVAMFIAAVVLNVVSVFYVYRAGMGADGFISSDGGVSNITRSATIIASVDTFLDNALTGVGFGQGAFGLVERMPSWAYRSYEIIAFTQREGATAPIFSLPARIGSELGVVGFLAWYGGIAWIMLALLSARYHAPSAARSPDAERATIAVLCSMFSLIGAGLSVGSFRLVMIWVTIGCAAYLIGHYRLSFINKSPSFSDVVARNIALLKQDEAK